ncbi:MAG: ATP-binding protein [Acidobacteriota bacterium]|nr:ATP-binding protein [Acidobacteriota bacterium]
MNTHSLRFRMTAWYAGLLTISLLVFSASVYLGLEHYLDTSLQKTLAEQARTIGEKLLAEVSKRGENYVAGETAELAPEINGRFIRITRQDGTILYRSGLPRDGSFDPDRISAATNTRKPSYRREMVGGTPLSIYTYPYTTFQGKRFLIESGAPYQRSQTALKGLLEILAFGLPLIVAGAIAGGYWVMERALEPVNDIAEHAERISSRNLSERLPQVHSGDEIERLSNSLNRMISRLDESFQHINRFSADVSHELRTPLTIIRGELEALAENGVPTRHLEVIGSALEETERLGKIVEQLLEISQLDAGEACSGRIRLDLGLMATSTVEQLHLLADEKAVSLAFDITNGVVVEANEIRLRQVIANLLDNAIKYCEHAGRITVSVKKIRDRAVLEITDNGVGIDAKSIPHIFERFFRADRARSRASGGSGLGLAIVKAICTAHGADVSVESAVGQGSVFRVEWPLAVSYLLSPVAEVASSRM